MTATNVQDDIARFFDKEILRGRASIEPSTPLLAWGLLDSLSMVQLIAYAKERFGVTIPGHAMVGENFQNLECICTLISGLLDDAEAPVEPAR